MGFIVGKKRSERCVGARRGGGRATWVDGWRDMMRCNRQRLNVEPFVLYEVLDSLLYVQQYVVS